MNWHRWLRRVALICAVSATASAFIVVQTQDVAFAAKRNKRKKKGKAKQKGKNQQEPQREIRKEGELEPKKDYDFSEDVSKTKALTVEDLGSGPSLTAAELQQQKTENLLDEKLEEEIGLSRSLLELEPECEGFAPVRIRLADLYWEQSKRAFFKANDSTVSEAQRTRFRDIMKQLQERTLDNYSVVVDECADYSDYPRVLFNMGRTLTELERARDGAAYFKRIIQEFPTSEWMPQAWFMVGEYYFNAANDAKGALAAYKKATESPESPIYGFAVYKQGWCYINMADWDLAMEQFRKAVSISDDPKQALDAKARKALRKEALKDFVRAYANVGDAKNAYRTFGQVGGVDAVQQMLETLGNWYINQGNYTNVTAVYRDLIKHYSKSTRLPVYQGRIVDASSRSGDHADTVKQVKLLTRYFTELRLRIAKGDIAEQDKESLKSDTREAEEIAENTVRRLALEYHKEAKKLRGSGRDRTYKYALELYRNYLDIFPTPIPGADVNYVFFMRFYYAEVLYKLEEFLEAAKNYDAVVEMNKNPTDAREKEMVLAAAEEAVRSYSEVVEDYDRKDPPTVDGTEKKPIPEIKQQLIAACQRYIDYVGSQGDKIVEIRYKMARIYYTYNHFDKAAPAFDDIVENHPSHEVACYSANLALDIYNGMKDYRALKEKAGRYVESKSLACGDEDKQKFAKITEQASFHLIKSDLEEKKKYIAAGNAYLKFYRDFPKSEFADDAIYNASVSYDQGNRLDKANEMREFLVNRIPDSPLVPETLYNIAQSYERIVDFDKASQYLERFAKNYPDDKRSKDAIYNAGIYRATLRDFAGARESRSRFLKLYPNDPEAANVAWANCESAELEAKLADEARDKTATKKWTDAHDCYYDFIRNPAYVRSEPDLLCVAQFRRGEIMLEKTRYTKGYLDQKKFIFKSWPEWKKKHGLRKVPQCAAVVSELQFRDLEPEMGKYRELLIAEINPTDQGKKKYDASIREKTKVRDALAKQYREIVELGVARWSLAALFMIGELYRDSVDKLLIAKIPDKIPGYKLSKEDKDMLRGKLRETALPIEESAVEAYRICVDKANELGVYNKWSMQALQALQKLRPESYPPVTERLVNVAFHEPLAVVGNGLVIDDAGSYKPIRLNFTEATDAAEKPVQAKQGGADAPADAAPESKGTSSSPSSLPAPVEEE